MFSQVNVNKSDVLTKHCFFAKLSNASLDNSGHPQKILKNVICINENNNFYLDSVEFSNNYSPLIKTNNHTYSNYAITFQKEFLLLQDQFLDLILSTDNSLIESYNIPQFSNFQAGTFTLVDILIKAGNFGPTFRKIGYYLLDGSRSKVALTKYGENHAKLAELLDLVFITSNNPRQVYLTEIGLYFNRCDKGIQEKLLCFQLLKVPILKKIFLERIPECSFINLLNNYLSASTSARRLSNLRYLVNYIEKAKVNSNL